LEASANEPEPVLSLRTVIGLLGWLTILTGIFLLIVACSSLRQTACSTKLTAYSTAATVAGALILATAWLTGERGDKTPLKMSVKMLARYLLIFAGLAAIITVFLLLAFLGLQGP
jgi:uncharacterized membrane protein HdeD (DUF308 family)